MSKYGNNFIENSLKFDFLRNIAFSAKLLKRQFKSFYVNKWTKRVLTKSTCKYNEMATMIL